MNRNIGPGVWLVLALIVALAIPAQSVLAASVVPVYNLQPSWTALDGGGVFAAYIGPPAYGYVSPGMTALYDGRGAGIIKAGLAVDPTSGIYEDEGIFGFQPNVTIDVLATGPLTYDVENQAGVNPVWMTIEIDTGVVGVRTDNTTYQFVPTSNPAGWHTVNAAAGQWQQWTTYTSGITVGPLMTLGQVVSANTGLNVVRAFLRLGMGNSYNNGGTGTIGWVDKATLGGVTYDFAVANLAPVTTDPLFCVGESTTVNIDLGGVTNLYGYQFTVSYTNPTLVTAAGAFVNSFFDTADPAFRAWDADCSTAGVCKFSVTRTNPQVAISGSGTLARITFTGVAPGTSSITIGDNVLSDRDGAPLSHTLGAPLPITVCGSATVSGKVTMQGRFSGNVDAGTVTLTDLGGNFPPTSGPFSATDGAFSLSVPVMPAGSNYQMDAAHGLYLTNRKTSVALTAGMPLANQNTRLWGGDATNDGNVKIADLSCIGGAFGQSPVTTVCGGPPTPTGSPDINADGKVNIQDLSIAGGNLDKCGAQPWDWVGGTPVICSP